MRGILLMAYGTPNGLEGVEEYYTNILRGKKPSPEQLKRLKDRYSAIGGSSPLLEITNSTALKLSSILKSNGETVPVFVGMKYSSPYISDALKEAMRAGIDELICIPIAPFYSKIGTGSYYDHLDKALKEINYSPKCIKVTSWNTELGLINAWKESITALNISKEWVFLFTAHSLPLTKEDNLETYRRQIIKTANEIERNFGNKWSLSFQSAADMPGEWITPDIKNQIKGLSSNGIKKLVIIPLGFVADNLETMYDVGIECSSLCKELGIEVKIARMPNDSDGIISALHGAYTKAIKQS